MVWGLYPTETTGTDGRFSPADMNLARNFQATWLDVSHSGSAVTFPGDGAYRVLYSGAQNLDTINGTENGDKGYLIVHHSAAGGNLTVRHGVGNIRTPGGVSIVFDDDLIIAQWCNIGDLIKIHGVG